MKNANAYIPKRYTVMLYIGNDLNDYEAMKLVGLVGAPADAEEEILAIADWISTKKGGYGVIRELARILCSGPNADQ